MARAFWLLKTEPETYSFQQLLKQRKTNWNDVRNFQARNFLREVGEGDHALIYHSGSDKAVVGIAEVIKKAYPDPDPEMKGDWVQIDIQALKALPKPVPLALIRETPALKELLLLKQSRLSVMPVTPKQFEALLKLGGLS